MDIRIRFDAPGNGPATAKITGKDSYGPDDQQRSIASSMDVALTSEEQSAIRQVASAVYERSRAQIEKMVRKDRAVASAVAELRDEWE